MLLESIRLQLDKAARSAGTSRALCRMSSEGQAKARQAHEQMQAAAEVTYEQQADAFQIGHQIPGKAREEMENTAAAASIKLALAKDSSKMAGLHKLRSIERVGSLQQQVEGIYEKAVSAGELCASLTQQAFAFEREAENEERTAGLAEEKLLQFESNENLDCYSPKPGQPQVQMLILGGRAAALLTGGRPQAMHLCL